MAKFDLNQLMNDKSKSVSGKDAIAFKIDFIPIDKIEPSAMNKYSVADVAELKASIEYSGLQQNLLVRQRDGADTYEIISGHRRFKALQELNAAGNEEFTRIPCKIIKSIGDLEAEIQLILANSTSRRLTDYEVTYQAARLKQLLTELKDGGYKVTGRKREIIAGLLGVSAAQVGRMESINNNLSPELKEEFKQENIGITTAYELSRLDGDQQDRALEEHKSGGTLTPERVKQRKEKPPAISAPQADKKTEAAAQAENEPEAGTAEPPTVHELKIYPKEFNAIRRGLKTFEYRFNDRGYKTGDILRLCEYLPDTEQFTGRHIDAEVIYLLVGGQFGVPAGYVIMSVVKMG